MNKAIPDRWAPSEFLTLTYWQPLGKRRAYKVRDYMEDMTGMKPVGPDLPRRRQDN